MSNEQSELQLNLAREYLQAGMAGDFIRRALGITAYELGRVMKTLESETLPAA